jgi:hypothetical protein
MCHPMAPAGQKSEQVCRKWRVITTKRPYYDPVANDACGNESRLDLRRLGRSVSGPGSHRGFG